MNNSSRTHLLLIRRKATARANGPDAPTYPAGDTRLWAALCNTFGSISGGEGMLLRIEWSAGEPSPEPEFYGHSLGLKGLYDVELVTSLPRTSILIRGRGGLAEPLTTLLTEWCHANGFRPSAEFWSARLIEVQRERTAATAEEENADEHSFFESVSRVLLLGERSGIYHPDLEEAQVFLKGTDPAWPSLAQDHLPTHLPPHRLLLESLGNLESSFARRDVTVEEHRPRTPTVTTELKPAIETLLWSWNDPQGWETLGTRAGPPLHMIVGIPNQADRPDWARKIRRECEKIASLYDRSIGTLDLRESRTLVPTIEVSSPLPLVHRAIKTGLGKKSSLYMLGPWDMRNSLIERRIENFSTRIHREFLEESEVVEGSQDWIDRAVKAISGLPGFTFQEEPLRQLLSANLLKARTHRLAFFWAEDDFLQEFPSIGVPLVRLGTKNLDGKLRVGSFEDDMSMLKRGVMPPIEEHVHWYFPELKSPTYGYEKATLFPDRYLMKILSKGQTLSDWQNQLWLAAGGDRLRSAPFRNELCTSLEGFRWTDGEHIWAEASGSREGWTDVEPRLAGIACVDAALRALLALGARPRNGGLASIWVTQPEKGNEDDDERARLGAYMLSLQGLTQALRGFDFKVLNYNVFAPTFGPQRPEIRVYLRARLTENAPQVIPGFRMSGEVLYSVGPRPAFMDAGSHLLDHVKVMSNHLSRLVPSAQLELYDLLWDLMRQGVITSIRPVGEGGIAETAAEMALWGGMGAQLRPNLPTIELFSGAPGRFLVGVLPSEAKRFESLVKSELLTTVGTSGGEKVLGLTVDQLRDARRGRVEE